MDEKKLEHVVNFANKEVEGLLSRIDDEFDDGKQKLHCMKFVTESLLHITLAALNDHLTPEGYAIAFEAFQEIIEQHKDTPVPPVTIPPVSGLN